MVFSPKEESGSEVIIQLHSCQEQVKHTECEIHDVLEDLYSKTLKQSWSDTQW